MAFKFITIFLILALITIVVSQQSGSPCLNEKCASDCGPAYLGFCSFGVCNCQSLETGETCVYYHCGIEKSP